MIEFWHELMNDRSTILTSMNSYFIDQVSVKWGSNTASDIMKQFLQSINAGGGRASSNLVRYRMEMQCRLSFANGVEIENVCLKDFCQSFNEIQNVFKGR